MSQYPTLTNFGHFLVPTAFEGVADAEKTDALVRASGELDDALVGGGYTLPLVAPYPDSLINDVCAVAAYRLLFRRGFDPEGSAQNIVDEYKRALKKWERLASGIEVYGSLVDSDTTNVEGEAFVVTSPKRGW